MCSLPGWLLFAVATYSAFLGLVVAFFASRNEHRFQTRQSILGKCDRFCEDLGSLAVRYWSVDTSDANRIEMKIIACQIQQCVFLIFSTVNEKLQTPSIRKASSRLSIITEGDFFGHAKKADHQKANMSMAAINDLRVEIHRAI